ncbi:MAG: AAA family ATPase [Bacteroidetes bacterium]|nr:AAA family ATPase [Bacteroidota bacterium]
MYLQQLSIENFRNITSLALSFSHGLNVIVGENNIGKSNIVDAIQIGLGSLQASRDDLPYAMGSNATIKIALTYKPESEAERAAFLDILDFDAEHPEASTARINFEWSFSNDTNKWTRRRWGGRDPDTERTVPEDVLQALKVTALDALRDSVSELRPGPRNRLASLFGLLAKEDEKATIVEVFRKANQELKKDPLVKRTSDLLQSTLTGSTGKTLGQSTEVATSESEFERIVRNLKILIGDSEAHELSANGLGYNNLLYIACVLAELGSSQEGDYPLLLVEEPEAHLHPQLQTILASFLSNGLRDVAQFKRKPQVIITTHSPTIAAHVMPSQIRYLYKDNKGAVRFFSFEGILSKSEERRVQRMLDVTRASMLFAKGIIFVEGESETILLPVLAERSNQDLLHHAIAIVSVCGVDFTTLASLFGETRIQIPVAVVTDGDPAVDYAQDSKKDQWKYAVPRKVGDKLEQCARVTNLIELFGADAYLKLFVSSVTLEYDIADAGNTNPEVMTIAWQRCYEVGSPRTLTTDIITALPSDHERTLAVWRGICIASPNVRKPVFAQELAEMLSTRSEGGTYAVAQNRFVVPTYLSQAFAHVVGNRVPKNA